MSKVRKATANEKAEAKAEAIAVLRKRLKPGDTVYTVLRHVSASGMSRRIDLYVIRGNRPEFLTGWVGKVLGYTHHKDGGLLVGGCGMDMGFHLVHSLGYALWGGIARYEKGPRATKVRQLILKADPHYFTQGGGTAPDPAEPSDQWYGGSGYALRHEWL